MTIDRASSKGKLGSLLNLLAIGGGRSQANVPFADPDEIIAELSAKESLRPLLVGLSLGWTLVKSDEERDRWGLRRVKMLDGRATITSPSRQYDGPGQDGYSDALINRMGGLLTNITPAMRIIRPEHRSIVVDAAEALLNQNISKAAVDADSSQAHGEDPSNATESADPAMEVHALETATASVHHQRAMDILDRAIVNASVKSGHFQRAEVIADRLARCGWMDPEAFDEQELMDVSTMVAAGQIVVSEGRLGLSKSGLRVHVQRNRTGGIPVPPEEDVK